MRSSLQSIVTTVLAGCLLALLVGPTDTPTPAAPRGSASLTRPESGVVSLTPTLSLGSEALLKGTNLTPQPPSLQGKGELNSPPRFGEPGGLHPTPAAPFGPGWLGLGEGWGEGRGRYLPDARPPRRPASLASATDAATIHRVEAGDTVYELAAQYGTSPGAILDANGLDEQSARFLDIGQELVIPGAGNGSQPALAPRVVHQVQVGEALITIARDYGTTVDSIVAANGLTDAELILAGQELIVPVPPGTTPAPPAPPMSGKEVLTQTPPPNPPSLDRLGTTPSKEGESSPTLASATAPELVPTGPITPTLPLTQTDAVDTVPQMSAVEPLTRTSALTPTPPMSATEPLTPTAAITEIAPAEPVTATAETAETPVAAIIETAPTEPVIATITETAPTEPMTATAEIAQAPADAAQAEAGPALELAMLEGAMLEAVNAERAAHGLHPYRLDETLAAVAQAHALDMAARDYTGHTSPEGKQVRDRLRDAGLDLDRAGENYYVSTRPAQEAATHTLSWFMGHPPHRDNILHDYYTRIGVGVAYTPPGWYIFVLDFAGE